MQGTRTRLMAVAKRIPNPNEMAIGMMYCACSDVSKAKEGEEDEAKNDSRAMLVL